MTNFDADTLRELRDLQEVAIWTEKHPKSAVVIWVAVADDEVFVRSVRGSKGRWYRDLAADGPATLEFAGRRLAVQAIPASDPAAAGRASRECGPGAPLARISPRGYAGRTDPKMPTGSLLSGGVRGGLTRSSGSRRAPLGSRPGSGGGPFRRGPKLAGCGKSRDLEKTALKRARYGN